MACCDSRPLPCSYTHTHTRASFPSSHMHTHQLLALLRDKAAAREAKLSSALREADGAGRLQEEARAVLEDTRAAKQEAEVRVQGEVAASPHWVNLGIDLRLSIV